MTKVLYIFGAGHCGSTLVSIYLNAQRGVFCAGEMWNISDVGLPEPEKGRSVWEAAILRFQRKGGDFCNLVEEGKSRFSLFGRSHRVERQRIGQAELMFMDALGEATNSQVVVDTSKGWRRLDMLLCADIDDVHVLHLVRDGRAIVHSYARKYDGRYVAASRRWVTSVVTGWLLRIRHPRSQWTTLRYEDFCAAPTSELERILAFAGLTKNGPINQPDGSRPYIAVAGNRMRQTGKFEVSQDEKWRRDLPSPVRFLFNATLGWLNFVHGYAPWR